jgi:hypothetical protein
MTERDWRIFNEDFQISIKTKGSRKYMNLNTPAVLLAKQQGSKEAQDNRTLPHPIRSWAESTLSPELLRAIEAVH